MIQVINREPAAGQAGRVKLTLDDGTVLEGVLSMDDGASPEGTPWNAQTGRLLQADIRTYPAATAITAGDVVDISNGQATTDGTPGQGIALQTVQAGVEVDVIFSGAVFADWATAGQFIDSPGVKGESPVDGTLFVVPQGAVSSIVWGTYTGNGSVEGGDVTQKINLGKTPQMVTILSSVYSKKNAFRMGGIISIPYGAKYYPAERNSDTTTLLEIVSGGFEVTSAWDYSGSGWSEEDPALNSSGERYLYIAII